MRAIFVLISLVMSIRCSRIEETAQEAAVLPEEEEEGPFSTAVKAVHKIIEDEKARHKELEQKNKACQINECPEGFECIPRFNCAPRNAYCNKFGVYTASCVRKKTENENKENEENEKANENKTKTEDKAPTISEEKVKKLCENQTCGQGLICTGKYTCAPSTSEFCKLNGQWVPDCIPDTNDKERCTYPRDIGDCRASLPAWYFNSQSNRCEEFMFGGCDGNGNRFTSQEDCQRTCEKKS